MTVEAEQVTNARQVLLELVDETHMEFVLKLLREISARKMQSAMNEHDDPDLSNRWAFIYEAIDRAHQEAEIRGL